MYCSLLFIAVIIIIVLSLALYQKTTNAICVSRRRLEGRTVIVTGGTAGMGLIIATDLAHRGARVIIACPFDDEGDNARKQIIKQTENQNVVFKNLDLGSLESTRQFAKDILKNEDRLDILLNNAGVGIPGDFVTKDGMHFIMQVNYYGTCLLTLLLLPLLMKTGRPGDASRIVMTASILHNIGQLDLDNLNRTNYWNLVRVYGNSKICLVSFAHELSKRLKECNVVVNTVEPGLVGTQIYHSASRLVGAVVSTICILVYKTAWEGAQTALHVALDKKSGEISGAYFKDCKLIKPNKRATKDEVANSV